MAPRTPARPAVTDTVETPAGTLRSIRDYRMRGWDLEAVCRCRHRWRVDLIRAAHVFGETGTTDQLLARTACPACGKRALRLDPVVKPKFSQPVWFGGSYNKGEDI